jgi:hypothetical protein
VLSGHRPSISLTVPLSIDTDMVDGSINGMDNGGVGVLEEEEQTIVSQGSIHFHAILTCLFDRTRDLSPKPIYNGNGYGNDGIEDDDPDVVAEVDENETERRNTFTVTNEQIAFNAKCWSKFVKVPHAVPWGKPVIYEPDAEFPHVYPCLINAPGRSGEEHTLPCKNGHGSKVTQHKSHSKPRLIHDKRGLVAVTRYSSLLSMPSSLS